MKCPQDQVLWQSPGGNYCWFSKDFEPGLHSKESGWIKMAEPRDPLLVEREKTHGSFEYNAQVWSAMCAAIPSGFAQHNPRMRLAVNMMLLKISRLVSGPSTAYKDHLEDIAGYAKLGSEACD
jgi:hypothetical protein